MSSTVKARRVSAKLEARYQRRCSAVDAVARGEPIEDVCRVMNIPRRTLFKWLEVYRHRGYDALRDEQRSGRARKVNADVMRWLYEAITKHDPRQYRFAFCLWTLALVRILLKRKFDIELSKSGVSRLLRHLGLSPQRPIYKSYKRNPEAMKKYLEQTFPGLMERARRLKAVIYFVDEASVRSDAHRGTTWGAIGQTPEVPDSGSRFTLKLISAVTPRGDMRFSSLEGRMTGLRFVEFLKKLLTDTGRPIIVISDNAAYHRGKPVKNYVAESKGQVEVE